MTSEFTPTDSEELVDVAALPYDTANQLHPVERSNDSELGVESARLMNLRFRQNRIVESLQRAPKTIKNLSDVLEINYNTVRKDCRDLLHEHRIRPTGRSLGGAIEYMAGVSSVIPSLYNTITGQDQDMIKTVEIWIEAGKPVLKSTDAAGDIIPCIMQFLVMLYNARAGGNIDELTEVRLALYDRLVENKKAMASILGMYTQMVNSILFNHENLIRFVNNNDIPIDAIKALHERYQGQSPVERPKLDSVDGISKDGQD